jgi:hypothetical protein
MNYYVDENGELRFQVFKIYAEYFTLTNERKLEVLLTLQDWITTEMGML